MSEEELVATLSDMLELVDRSNYVCSDDLATELQEELEDRLTESQLYAIADMVETWWLLRE
jgi:hypothetical protein